MMTLPCVVRVRILAFGFNVLNVAARTHLSVCCHHYAALHTVSCVLTLHLVSYNLFPTITCAVCVCVCVIVLAGLRNIFNFTIASCQCFSCCLSSHHSDESTSIEDVEIRDMKERLTFHFMNPFQKWRYPKNRRFPWKLLIQLVSILLVTSQVSEDW